MLRIMDACGVEHLVNITMQVGNKAYQIMDRFHRASDRFSTIGWMDWTGVERSDFEQLTLYRLERLIEYGAVGIKFWKDLGLTVRDANADLLCIDDERLTPNSLDLRPSRPAGDVSYC